MEARATVPLYARSRKCHLNTSGDPTMDDRREDDRHEAKGPQSIRTANSLARICGA
jgi:hypothetical protein